MDDIGNAKWYVVNVVCNCYSPDAFVSSIVMVVLLSFSYLPKILKMLLLLPKMDELEFK